MMTSTATAPTIFRGSMATAFRSDEMGLLWSHRAHRVKAPGGACSPRHGGSSRGATRDKGTKGQRDAGDEAEQLEGIFAACEEIERCSPETGQINTGTMVGSCDGRWANG